MKRKPKIVFRTHNILIDKQIQKLRMLGEFATK